MSGPAPGLLLLMVLWALWMSLAESAASFDVRPFRRLANISVEDFELNYAAPEAALPTVFSNTTDDVVFDASQWTREKLYQHCGSSPLLQPHKGPHCTSATASRNPDCHHVRIVHPSLAGQTWGGITVADLNKLRMSTVRDVLTIQDRSPLGYQVVLFDAPLLHLCPHLKESIRVPKYFPRDYYLIIDWLSGKNPSDTRNWPSIIVSKKGGGTYLHADSGMTRFWAQQLAGRKRWRVFSLSESHKLYPIHHIHYYYPIVFQIDAFHPDFDKFPDLAGATVYETITEPGDVIFIPEGWPHQVENLEDSVLTSMNFLDNHAIQTATKHLPHFQLFYDPELFAAFFMPLDNPVHDNGNIEFKDYFASRFLNLDTSVPASVEKWVSEGGATAIDTEWDADGLPALHVTVFYNFFVVIEYLIEKGGANVNTKARNGMTPLDFAESTGRWEMRELLISYGAKGRLMVSYCSQSAA